MDGVSLEGIARPRRLYSVASSKPVRLHGVSRSAPIVFGVEDALDLHPAELLIAGSVSPAGDWRRNGLAAGPSNGRGRISTATDTPANQGDDSSGLTAAGLADSRFGPVAGPVKPARATSLERQPRGYLSRPPKEACLARRAPSSRARRAPPALAAAGFRGSPARRVRHIRDPGPPDRIPG